MHDIRTGKGLEVDDALVYRSGGRDGTIPAVMSPEVEIASEWLERARQNAGRFSRLLEADLADLRANQVTAEKVQAAAKVERIQCVLGRIIAEMDDDPHGVLKQENDHK